MTQENGKHITSKYHGCLALSRRITFVICAESEADNELYVCQKSLLVKIRIMCTSVLAEAFSCILFLHEAVFVGWSNLATKIEYRVLFVCKVQFKFHGYSELWILFVLLQCIYKSIQSLNHVKINTEKNKFCDIFFEFKNKFWHVTTPWCCWYVFGKI